MSRILVGSATKVTMLYKNEEYSLWTRSLNLDFTCGEIVHATVTFEHDINTRTTLEKPEKLVCFVLSIAPRMTHAPSAGDDTRAASCGVEMVIAPMKTETQTKEWFDALLPRVARKLPVQAMTGMERWCPKDTLDTIYPLMHTPADAATPTEGDTD